MMQTLSSVPASVALPVYMVALFLPFYVPLVIYRGARRLGYPPARARGLALKLAALLWAWLLAAVLGVITGAVVDGPGRIPWFGICFLPVIVAGVLGARRWGELWRVMSNRQTLAELVLCQTCRWLGSVFLTLHAGGQLPEFFAYPAGWGDILVGLTCTLAVITLWSTQNNSIPITWTLLGLLDFVGAVGTAATSSKEIHLVDTTPPSSEMFNLPMFLIPGYLVLFSIVLHIITLMLLRGPLRRAATPTASSGHAFAGN